MYCFDVVKISPLSCCGMFGKRNMRPGMSNIINEVPSESTHLIVLAEDQVVLAEDHVVPPEGQKNEQKM